MQKHWLLAAFLIAAGLLAGRSFAGEHPDTSSVAAYAPYAQIPQDIAPSWSVDDAQILFTRLTVGVPKLYTISASGGAARAFFNEIGGLGSWSPDGTRVAFSSDRRGGRLQFLPALGASRPINIWTAGAPGGDLRQITTATGNCLDPVWSPDGKQIAFTAHPGPHVMRVPTSAGEAKAIADGFSPAWSPDGKRIAFFAGDAGDFDPPLRLYILPLEGGDAVQFKSFFIDAGSYVRPSIDWSPDGQRLLSVRLENGRWHPIIVNVKEDRIERSIAVPGSAINPRWSHDGKTITYALSDTSHPYTIETLTLANGKRTQLTAAEQRIAGQLIRYKVQGDITIPSWLYLPRPSGHAKRPALLWLHGGMPGAGSVGDGFDPLIHYFVDQGFVVLAPNYRGSAGFGPDLAKGFDPLQDIAGGVDYLKTLDQVDLARIGVVGFSFGGYLALQTLTHRPQLFAAAVDFYGPSDAVSFYRSVPKVRQQLSELLGGTPEQNPKAYHDASPINFVNQIQTPLLILFGTNDHPGYEQSIELDKALKQANKNYQYLTYPNAGHGFAGKDEIDGDQQAMRFLLSHLAADRGQ